MTVVVIDVGVVQIMPCGNKKSSIPKNKYAAQIC